MGGRLLTINHKIQVQLQLDIFVATCCIGIGNGENEKWQVADIMNRDSHHLCDGHHQGYLNTTSHHSLSG